MRFAVLAVAFASTTIACKEKRLIMTPHGSVHVPGHARTEGEPSAIKKHKLSNGCEFHGGGQVILKEVKKTEGGDTLVLVDGIHGCPTGWLNANFLVPLEEAERKGVL